MITNTTIGTTNTTIYTSSGSSAVNLMVFCNTDTTNTALLTIYVVPNGQTTSTIHTIIKQTRLLALETLTFSTEKLVLANGDFVVAKATQTDGSSSIAVVSTVSSITL
jgi:hypothetical protein